MMGTQVRAVTGHLPLPWLARHRPGQGLALPPLLAALCLRAAGSQGGSCPVGLC